MSRMKLVLLVVMSAVGLAASAMVFLIYYLLRGELPLCTAGNAGGITIDCNLVLGSKYSSFFGVPLELFAVAYFIVNLCLVYAIAFGPDAVFRKSLNVLFVWRFIGLAIVPYLISVELLILHAICIYCTIMHVSIITDFAVISYVLFYKSDDLWAASVAPGQAPVSG